MWRFFLVFVYYSSIGLSLCIMNTICVFWGNKPMSRKERDEIKQTVQRKWWIAYHQHRSLQSLTNQNTYHIKSQRQTHKTIKHFRTVKSFSSLVGLVSSGEFRNVRMIVCVCVFKCEIIIWVLWSLAWPGSWYNFQITCVPWIWHIEYDATSTYGLRIAYSIFY